MAFVDKMSKNGISYDIQDARLANLEASAEDLNKIKDLEGTQGQVLVFNAQGGIEGSDALINKADLDPTTHKILDSQIPSGFVTSVNHINPVEGNVDIVRVSLADNLFSPDNLTSTGTYNRRTSGGDESISTGEASLVYVEGHSIVSGRTTESITPAITPTTLTASVNAATWRNNATVAATGSGVYPFVYANEAWTLNSVGVNLADFGITVNGWRQENILVNAFPSTIQATMANLATWKAKAMPDGQHLFTYDGTTWKYAGQYTVSNMLTEYGIDVTGTLPTSSFSTTYQSVTITGVTLDETAYKSCGIPEIYDGTNKTTVFTYMQKSGGYGWFYASATAQGGYAEVADMSAIGISITGDPAENNTITVVYTAAYASVSVTWTAATQSATLNVTYIVASQGTIYSAKPKTFKSVMLNAFNKNNAVMTLADKKINATTGVIENNSGTSVIIVPTIGGVVSGSGLHGYSVTLLDIVYDGSTPVEGHSTNITNYKNYIYDIWVKEDVVASGTLEKRCCQMEDGMPVWNMIAGQADADAIHCDWGDDNCYMYITVDSTKIPNVVVHPTWSGYEDDDYAPYAESVITIPLQGKINGEGELTNLPVAIYGMPSVTIEGGATLRDKMDFDRLTYTQKIERRAYSTSNLNYAIAYTTTNHTGYDYDSEYIYIGLKESDYITYTFTSSGVYDVHDFGTEGFTFDASDPQIPLVAQTLYGHNLRDKLRADVLTISAQSLSASQQLQVQDNLGVYSTADVDGKFTNINYVRNTTAATGGSVSLNPNQEMAFTNAVSAALTLNLVAGEATKATEWRALFLVDSSADVTVTPGMSGKVFLTDDGPVSTITCEKGKLYEISFCQLTGSYIGVIAKDWTVTA